MTHAKSQRREEGEDADIGLAEGQGDRSKGGNREDYPVKQMPGYRLIHRNGRGAVRITSRLRAFARVTSRAKLRDCRTRGREGTKEESPDNASWQHRLNAGWTKKGVEEVGEVGHVAGWVRADHQGTFRSFHQTTMAAAD